MGPSLSTILYTVMPLLAGDHSALFRIFRTIRHTALSSASGIVSLVMGIACIIIVIKLIKLTYDLESDEQQAGFGGVTLWQLVRPVVILFALNIYPILLGAIDSVADSITTSIVATADKMDTRKLIGDRLAIADAATDEELTQEEMEERIRAHADEETQRLIYGSIPGQSIETVASYNLLAKVFGNRRKIQDTTEDLINWANPGMTESEYYSKEMNERRKQIKRYVAAYYNVGKASDPEKFKLTAPGTWVPALCNIIYDFAFIIIECGAEIILCILCFAGPVVLTVSLMDQYKHAFMEFVMRYFQFSFWKVVAAIINWAVRCAQTGACSEGSAIIKERLFDALTTDSGAEAAGAATGALWITAIIALAGIFCFSKIGELAAYFIPVNGGGMATGAGAALAAGAGAASSAARGAQTLAGGVQGVRSFSQAQEQAQNIRDIAAASKAGSKVSQGGSSSTTP